MVEEALLLVKGVTLVIYWLDVGRTISGGKGEGIV